ncbi:hypothetical protein JI735_06930 [Paenibacillus sonchi]|uniref:Uncharacterized protein n=1 Tax=Paenibacillus sonchi TaxID=373687 RepID=A0A974SEK3_9BACL|nr:hypothetical protein [Paenibacillus sonchi]QQZ62336.1 hypothetical protein JI735_06930 [Paenibacillus sonchi]
MNEGSKHSTTAALSNEGRVAVVLLSRDDDYLWQDPARSEAGLLTPV